MIKKASQKHTRTEQEKKQEKVTSNRLILFVSKLQGLHERLFFFFFGSSDCDKQQTKQMRTFSLSGHFDFFLVKMLTGKDGKSSRLSRLTE